MNFSKQFSHAVTEQYVTENGKSITDYLPAAVSYSAEAAEHLIYLKAAGTFNLPAGSKYTQKNFHAYMLLYHASGKAEFSANGSSSILEDGQLCFWDCRSEYTLYCIEDCEFQVLFFDGYPVLYYYEQFSKRTSPIVTLAPNSSFPYLIYNLTSQNYIYTELNNAKLLTDILTNLILFCNIQQKDVNFPRWLVQLLEHLDANYTAHFSLDELSQQININKYQICREFKKYLKTTPLQYVNQLRIEKAKVLLRITTDQVSEIGYQVGFENANYFIQLFKREVGMTPAYYRKNGI
jgi:AraC-like DNA-binding protein